MSWLRIEGRMPQHHKIAPLSDAAFRLHVTAMAWSVEGKTDGRIPPNVPATLTCAPRGKKLADALSELVTARVWLSLGDDGFEIHDFLQWNLSAADIAARSEAKSKAGSAGGKRSGEARMKQATSKHEAPASHPLPPASPVLRVATKLVEAKPKPLSQSLSLSEEEAESAAAAAAKVAEINRERFPMRVGWAMSAENIAALEIGGVPRWAIDELIGRFRAHFVADQADIATATEWNQRCSKWVQRDWVNPRTKPSKPGAADGSVVYDPR